MKTGGLFLFATLGPNTLKELRAVFARASATQHINVFLDMHDIGDLLAQNGFESPVMETEIVTVEFESVRDLLGDLKLTGSTNTLKHRRRGLLGRDVYAHLLALDGESKSKGTRVKTTFEVVFGHAWASSARTTGEFPLLRR